MSHPVIDCACVGYRLTGVQQASIFIHFHCLLRPGRGLSFRYVFAVGGRAMAVLRWRRIIAAAGKIW